MTVLAPTDDLAIRTLYANYNHAIHRGDGAAWADCFTRDGLFSNRSTTIAGRAGLVEYASGWIGTGDARYWVDNLLLEATTNGATGTCYLAIVRTASAGAPPAVSLTGLYIDRLECEGGQWKFANRHIARDD